MIDCKEFRARHSSCGLYDDDDHTCPCEPLLRNGECPAGHRLCGVCGAFIQHGVPTHTSFIPVKDMPKGTLAGICVNGVACHIVSIVCEKCHEEKSVW